MKKVKLPREVAEAIEGAKLSNNDEFILWNSSRPESENKDVEYWRTLYNFVNKEEGMFKLADALRYGYEIEEKPITVTITPEQQKGLRKLYSDHSPATTASDYQIRFGVQRTLELLGIKIQGVND